MKKMSAMKKQEALTGICFAAPATIGLITFFIIPFFICIWYTFTFGIGGTNFVGLKNYISIMNSSAFKLASQNTIKFIGIGCPVLIIVSFFCAQIFQQVFPFRNIFKMLLVYPMIIPIAATVTIVNMFCNESGYINMILEKNGVAAEDLLKSPAAFWVLLILYWWKNCGYMVILQLSGLNAIPPEYYETADIFGANYFQKMTNITLPIMKPTLFFIAIISVVNSFKCFREAYMLGGTRPNNSIYMLQHFLNNNFENLNYQRLSVAAVITFIVIFIPVFLLYRYCSNLSAGKDNGF